MTGKLAFRNLSRNLRRTLLTGSVIAFGVAALVFTDGLMRGMLDAMVSNITNTYLGHVQIHRPGFRDDNDIDKMIVDPEALLERLNDDPRVEAVSPRAQAFGMVSSARDMTGVSVVGADPAAEAGVSSFRANLIRGEWISEEMPRGVLIGKKLAEILDVEIGDRVVLTGSQAAGRDLVQELFRVRGVFHMHSREIDRGMILVNLGRMQRIFGLGEGIHEIVVRLEDHRVLESGKGGFIEDYRADGIEVKPWFELVSGIQSVLSMSQYATLISGFILFGIIALVIMNTLYMSVYERMFEFGVMKALGTRSRGIFALVAQEGALLGFGSVIVGALLGAALVAWVAQVGIDYGDIEYAGASLHEPVKTRFHPDQVSWIPLAILLVTQFLALYPAWVAARLKPAETVKDRG